MASTRSTSRSGRTSAHAPLSHYNDQGVREQWPVLVYRLQSHRGWEVYSDPDKEETTGSALADGDGTNANAAEAPRASAGELTAAPRGGCIEVRKMRLRIQLFAQHTPWDRNRPHRPGGGRCRRGKDAHAPTAAASQGNEGEHTPAGVGADKLKATNDDENDGGEDDAGRDDDDDDDAPGADGWNNNSLIVRRRDTLLVTTRRGMGAVVFRFKSTRDCVDFCDRLTYLNREYLAPPRSADAEDAASATDDRDGYANGMDKRERHRDEMISDKRRRCVDMGAISTTLVDRPRSEILNEEAPATVEEVTLYRRQEELMSYVIRLSHCAEFGGFVDELERGLESAAETAADVAAFGL